MKDFNPPPFGAWFSKVSRSITKAEGKDMHEFLKVIQKFITIKEDFVKPLLKSCAEETEAERVGYWSVGEEVVFCESMYVEEKKEFTRGTFFYKEGCKSFLEALEREGIFESKRAQEDERIGECMGEYLRANNTNMLLCLGVWFEGRLVGFLTLEKSQRRQWATFEFYKALYITSLISLLFEKQRGDFLLRMYKTLYSVNSLILNIKERKELFSWFCRLAVEEGMFRMVWVGLLDEEGNVVPVASAGYVENYLSRLRINIYDERTNKGPTATAIREGKIQVNNDTETNPAMAPFREEMLKRGYLSSCAFPISFKGGTIGTINLYSDKKNFFSEEVIKLVEELGVDISFALEYMETLRTKNILYLAIEDIKDWVIITDKNGYIEYANPAVEEISGYKREEIIGKKTSIFRSGLYSEDFYKKLWDTILSENSFSDVFINRRKDGSLFYINERITPIKDEKGEIVGFISVGRDITQLREIEEKLKYLSKYDPFTGIANRDHFFEVLDSALKEGGTIAIAVVDIYNFSRINFLHGYSTGDKYLLSLAKKLSKVGDFCGRYGSDEFMLFKRLRDIKEFEKFVDDLLKVGKEIKLTLNVGLSLYPLDDSDPYALVEKAMYALKRAKSATSSYAFYSKHEEEEILRGLKIEEELNHALERGEFLLYFQPYYASKDYKVEGAEALLRWNSKSFGLLPAGKFIHLIQKRRELMDKMEHWVFETAIRLIKTYSIKIPISINLSPIHIEESFCDYIKYLLEKYEVSPNLINIEITEESVIKDADKALKVLKSLKEYGLKIILDDFGVMYSSLSLFSNFPVDYLKIDKSFVDRLDTDEKILEIVLNLINMCRALGIKTVAEGVEREVQANFLRNMGCDYIQGFYFSKPMPVEEFLKLL
ncbi:MAG: EAL domain-containing protein [Aquificaceae bacterium]